LRQHFKMKIAKVNSRMTLIRVMRSKTPGVARSRGLTSKPRGKMGKREEHEEHGDEHEELRDSRTHTPRYTRCLPPWLDGPRQ
jgi:hypothetical protein